MKTFLLPDLGEGLHEATLVEWAAMPQQSLKQGELLLTVETAKAMVEIPTPEDLTVLKHCAAIGDTIRVNTPLLHYQATTPTPSPPAKTHSISVVGELKEADTPHAQTDFILGSHAFSQADLEQAKHALLSKHTHTTSNTNNIAFTGSRLAMMKQLSTAHQQVALVTLFDEVLVKWPATTKPLPRLIQALCAACALAPKLNAWFKNETLMLQSDVNLGLAVNTPQGLFVPVIAQAQLLSLSALEEHIRIAKETATTPPIEQATISLSNFGMLAGRFATPLVVPPQVAILGVGRIQQQHIVSKKGNLKTKTVIPLSLSVDHRALTGAEAAQFLAAVMQHLKMI